MKSETLMIPVEITDITIYKHYKASIIAILQLEA